MQVAGLDKTRTFEAGRLGVICMNREVFEDADKRCWCQILNFSVSGSDPSGGGTCEEEGRGEP